MSLITVQLPDSLYERVVEFTAQEHSSIEHFALLAIAEKLSSLATVDYIEQRAKQANFQRWDELLAKVPDDTEPMDRDRLDRL